MGELANPLRIVCTKCVRIVRVHFQDIESEYDSTVVATECCRRSFGYISGQRIAMFRRGERDLTTDDIEFYKDADELERFIERTNSHAERNRARSEWARWSKAVK